MVRTFCTFTGGRAGTPVAPLGRYHSIPNSLAKAFHFESTSDFVFASMVISSGQGRAKPSVDHLRVASTPILEPSFGRREAWARESMGPRVQWVCCTGGMGLRARSVAAARLSRYA